MATAATTDAFGALFRAQWPAVHAYARRRCGNDADAHDVAAETFTVAWRRFDDIPVGFETPWLYRTAANVLANQRRGQRRAERLQGRLAVEPVPMRASLADAIVDDIDLRAAFATLTDDQRELLALVAWEGLDHAAIAVALDTSVNAVALRLSRARSRIEAALAEAESTEVPSPETRPTGPSPAGHGRSDDPGRQP